MFVFRVLPRSETLSSRGEGGGGVVSGGESDAASKPEIVFAGSCEVRLPGSSAPGRCRETGGGFGANANIPR